MGRDWSVMNNEKAYLVFNETLNTLAILYQNNTKEKKAVLKPLDRVAFKEEQLIVRNLKALTKDHRWILIAEL